MWGKPRTEYGKFIDSRGILQERIVEESGLNRDTVSRACNDAEYLPNGRTMKKLTEAARKLSGKDVPASRFWRL